MCLLALLALLPPLTPVLAAAPMVESHGALRAIVHERDLGAKTALAPVLAKPHAYAIGALAGLRGEITVIDGTAWLSYAGKDRTEKTTTSDEQAALLVVAHVPRWRRIRINRTVPIEDLEAFVAAQARKAGLGKKPFPFVIEGTFDALLWHVIDGTKLPAKSRSHEEHMQAAVQRTLDAGRATLVGFYSSEHQGVFTHQGENIHVHVVVPAENSSGHLDSATIRKGSTLLLPR